MSWKRKEIISYQCGTKLYVAFDFWSALPKVFYINFYSYSIISSFGHFNILYYSSHASKHFSRKILKIDAFYF
jgi:hypothetical protein